VVVVASSGSAMNVIPSARFADALPNQIRR
jgi:hypothetical protein